MRKAPRGGKLDEIDEGCWREDESALRRRSTPYGPEDQPKSPGSPGEMPLSDRPRPEIGEAEEVDQTILNRQP
jgi:hypothetical protein